MSSKPLLLTLLLVSLSGCSAFAGGVEDGEAYNVTFSVEGDCPPGTLLELSPTNEANATVRFWRVESAEQATFEVIGNRSYALRLVRPGMENQTMEWVASSKRVAFENTESGECSFDG